MAWLACVVSVIRLKPISLVDISWDKIIVLDKFHQFLKKLQFIHVGKCGGSTIVDLLHKSPVVRKEYSEILISHVCGVRVDPSFDFLICLRNPISRANSAFSWRNKLVVLDALPDQRKRFPGEYDVLTRYGSMDKMGSRLYRDAGSKLDQFVARDFNLIHHLRESISFYLEPLRDVLAKGNVFGVICQESLSEDCEKILGLSSGDLFVRRNEKKSSTTSLSEACIVNLRKYLRQDYVCIIDLWTKGIISDQKLSQLIFDPPFFP